MQIKVLPLLSVPKESIAIFVRNNCLLQKVRTTRFGPVKCNEESLGDVYQK